ncbi:MAG: hypothetical protein HY907_20485 [Deltaproteobacteria bacterium]|nr:hypothetical protein [Deltaproteobacteria bacterium]
MYLNDHLPTPKKLVDASRVVVWDGKMEPFGETEAPGATVEQPLRMPGQVLDSATALFYSGDRYIEPRAGRFLSPDPMRSSSVTSDPRSVLAVIPQWRALMMRQSVTVQAYGTARSNPLRYMDPTGMQVECVDRLLCDPGDQWRPPWELYDIDWDAVASALGWFVPTPCQAFAGSLYLLCTSLSTAVALKGSCPWICAGSAMLLGLPYPVCVAECSLAASLAANMKDCAQLADHVLASCEGH